MKKLPALLLLCLLPFVLLAQQHPQLTQYMQNSFLVNPAVAGIEDYADVRTGYRSQWVGVEGAPTTFYASIHAALNKSDRNVKPLRLQPGAAKSSANRNNRFYNRPHHGVGAIAQADQAGLLRASSLNLSYSYHLPLTASLNLSGGASAGARQLHINRQNLLLQQPDDPFINTDMPNIFKADLALGMWLYSRNFYLGISGTQLIGGKNSNAARGPEARMQPHYYLTGGYRINASRHVTLTPSVMVKSAEGLQTAVDVNLKAIYGQRFWGGISYRHQDAVAAMLGIYVNHLLDVSYSHDIVTSEMNKVSANSHEVVLGFKLNNPNGIICPKWIW